MNEDSGLTFRSNSHKSREEAEQKINPDKKTEKVINGDAKIHKKSRLEKLKDSFVSEDSKNVKSYIVGGVLIPSLKKAISDIVTTGIDMILYGESRHSRNSSGTGSKISYQKYYEREMGYRTPTRINPTYGYDVKEFVVDTRGEAESVLDQIEDMMSRYEVVTVSDYYDLLGVTGQYTDNYYGWTDISGMRTRAVRNGWLIELPPPKQIKG